MKNHSESTTKCPVCGFTYLSGYAPDERMHKQNHEKFLAAVEKFSFIFPHDDREIMKQKAWPIVHDKSRTLEERCEATEQILKSHFARSVWSNGYSLDHPGYPEYAAMQLHDVNLFKSSHGEDVYAALLAKYGAKPGIEDGRSIYNMGK